MAEQFRHFRDCPLSGRVEHRRIEIEQFEMSDEAMRNGPNRGKPKYQTRIHCLECGASEVFAMSKLQLKEAMTVEDVPKRDKEKLNA